MNHPLLQSQHFICQGESNNYHDRQRRLLSFSITRFRSFSTTSSYDKEEDADANPPPRFAAVHHAKAYEDALAGLHGKQLELAQMEGYGKDDPNFDPFAMDDEIDSLLDQAIRKAEVTGGDDDLNSDGVEESTVAQTNEVSPEDAVHDEDDKAFEVTDEVDDISADGEKHALPPMYNNDGSLRRKRSQLATLRAGYPSGGLFAILAMAGSQYKVTTDDVLIVNLLKPVTKFQVGSIHTLTDEDVLLLGSSHYTLVGMPYVKGAEVDVLVEEITKDAKVIVYKKRRRKNSKRKNGFRRDVTMLRILDIRVPEAYSKQYYVPRIEADLVDEDDNNDVAVA